jgi:hypothetical protein
MIEVKSFGKKKATPTVSTTSNGGGGFANITVKTDEVKGVNIWGQYHDHTGDVDGDLTANGDIVSTGKITASEGQINGNLGISGNTTIDGDISATNGDFSGNISADDGDFGGDIHCTDIDCDAIYSNDISTEYLTVTKQAHFFNLTIDEIKSVGGQIILSAANATIDHVEQQGGQYILCWKKDDGEKGISNQFKRLDQVICQTFDKTDLEGVVENKYYWGLVTTVGEGSYTENGEEIECNYIALSPAANEFDGSSVPAKGDKICQLGYRGTDDPARQSAIILSAYKSPDPNVDAPSIVQYAGINSFSLDGCIVNQMSPTENVFTGNFRVVSNGTTSDVVDLIQGQHPQVIADSEQAWIMADSSGKTYYSTDYQNLPTTIQAYLGSTLIPYSEWVTGSQIKFKNKTLRLTGTAPAISTFSGIGISSITRNTNDVTLSWSYYGDISSTYNTETGQYDTTNNGTTENNQALEITIKFTHNGTTYTVQKNVPFNVIKASAVTQGADAEFDRLMIDKLDLTVTLDNKLTCKVNAKVYHVKGGSIEQLTDLTDYTANILLSNSTTVTLTKTTYFYRTTNISNAYSSMTNPPTSATLRLYKNGTLVDEVATQIKFDAGSIFTITDNAITSAVQQAQTYTDGQITNVSADISRIEQTANSISTRVTNIENDYVTSSELRQTADNIQLNVYDDLLNKTGIDISNGLITLNGNTVVNGNLSLTDQNTGFSLIGDGGITQIMPQSIGSYAQFTAKSTTVLNKHGESWGAEKDSSGDYFIVYNFDTNFNVGIIKAGHTIAIAAVSRNYYIMDENGIYHQINSSQYSESDHQIIVYENGVSMATGSLGNSPFNYTSQGGNIQIVTVDRVSIDKNLIESSSPRPYQELIVPIEKIDITVTVPNDAFMLIGYDGLAVNFGTSATAYFGAESTTIKYGQHGIKISNSGLQKWNGSNWVGINNKKVKTITTDYTLTNDDDLIVYNSGTQRTLTLPSTLEVGKTVYIKRIGSTQLKVQSSTTNIYTPTATTGANNATLNNYTCLTWDGSRWLIGFLYS